MALGHRKKTCEPGYCAPAALPDLPRAPSARAVFVLYDAAVAAGRHGSRLGGLGFRFWGLEFRVWALGFRVWGVYLEGHGT